MYSEILSTFNFIIGILYLLQNQNWANSIQISNCVNAFCLCCAWARERKQTMRWHPLEEHPILYNLLSYWLYFVGDSLNFCVRFARFNEIRLVIDGRRTSRISWSRNFLWAVVVIAVDHMIARRHIPIHVQTHRTHGFSDGNLKCPLLLYLSLCQQTN